MTSRLHREKDWESVAHLGRYSPSAVALLQGVSLRQLERFFLETRGESPKKCLHDMRMKKAAAVLAGSMSVKEAAFELGYKDASHFIRDFRDYYGVTPGRWANQGNFCQARIAISVPTDKPTFGGNRRWLWLARTQ